MAQYYIATVSVEHVDGEKIKKVKEQYLVDAVSVTDAEVKVNEYFKDSVLDFEVSSVTRTKIVDVIN